MQFVDLLCQLTERIEFHYSSQIYRYHKRQQNIFDHNQPPRSNQLIRDTDPRRTRPNCNRARARVVSPSHILLRGLFNREIIARLAT